MKRVVVTGIGITSCLGISTAEVTESLRLGRSGIVKREEYIERGMRSHIAGAMDIDLSEHIDRKTLRFMGPAAGYAHMSLLSLIHISEPTRR